MADQNFEEMFLQMSLLTAEIDELKAENKKLKEELAKQPPTEQINLSEDD